MKIVSLYKIWRGREFLEESIASNYCHVDAMVFVSSNISWTGQTGNNTKDIVLKWKADNDCMDKIHVIDCDTTEQKLQYQHGVDYIHNHFPQADWMQIVDSDEVWDEKAWNNSIDTLYRSGKRCMGFCCIMRSFIKTREFVIDEGPHCVKPVVFVRADMDYRGCRFNKTPGLLLMNNVRVDHYGLVRNNWEDIKMKICTSQVGDGHDLLVDMEKWKAEVWDKVPDGAYYHYYKGCEDIWMGIYRRKD